MITCFFEAGLKIQHQLGVAWQTQKQITFFLTNKKYLHVGFEPVIFHLQNHTYNHYINIHLCSVFQKKRSISGASLLLKFSKRSQLLPTFTSIVYVKGARRIKLIYFYRPRTGWNQSLSLSSSDENTHLEFLKGKL